MIRKIICIAILLGAFIATLFAALNRENTHTLLPLLKPKEVVLQPMSEQDSVTVEQPDSIVVVLDGK